MKKILLFVMLLFASVAFSQANGITYQAIIYNPTGETVPGYNNANAPLANSNICLLFTIVDANSQLEYQEKITITTDEFGMVNTIIGSGNQTAGYASSFNNINWSNSQKSIKVALDGTGQCSSFIEISNQPLSYVPLAFAANSATNVTGIVSIANGGTNATSVVGAKTNLGLKNVDNTSDLNKPISTATRTSLDLKEDVLNKSVDVTLSDLTNTKFPTELAVKTYISTQIASATIIDADATSKGKIQLTGDLGGTAALPTVPGLALKLDANKVGVANGVASLNALGIIPTNQLPPVTVSSTNVVANQDEMLALSTATVGSIAVRTDVSKNYILAIADPTNLANWIELLTPGAPVQSVNGLTGSISLSKSDIGLANADNTSDVNKPISNTTQSALNLKLDTNLVGVPNGTASLNAIGKIPTDQIPAISFSSVKVLSSQADMLALNTAVVGSVVIRTDVNKNYVLAVSNPADVSNWIELLTPAPPVQSVNGYSGSVALTKSDFDLTNVENTSDANKPVSIATQTVLDLKANATDISNSLALKANLVSPIFTGTVSGIDKTMVGLTNVENTSDANKPISTATQAVLDLKENTANKSTNIMTDAASTTKYPSVKLIKDYVDTQTASTQIVATDSNTANQIVKRDGTGNFSANTITANLTGNVSGNANNITGIILGANGGTGIANPGKTITIGGNLEIGPSSGVGHTVKFTTTGTTEITLPTTGTLATLTQLDSKELSSNKSTDVTLGSTNNPTTLGDSKFPTQNAVKAYITSALSTVASPIVGYTTALQTNGNNAGTNNVGFGPSTAPPADGGGNTSIGSIAMQSNTSGWYNTAIGFRAMANIFISGSNDNVAIGHAAAYYRGSGWDTNNQLMKESIYIGSMSRASAINQRNEIVVGYNAIGNGSNTIQLGNTAITNTKTNGTITAGTVTYPNVHGTTGQVLSTAGSGALTWTSPIPKTTIASDQFSSTTDQTSFTLSQIPLNAKIWMFINGARTNNNAYSVNGTTVTYTAASNNGYTLVINDRIQFDYCY